jgi:hypothetical protein
MHDLDTIIRRNDEAQAKHDLRVRSAEAQAKHDALVAALRGIVDNAIGNAAGSYSVGAGRIKAARIILAQRESVSFPLARPGHVPE